MKKLFYLFMIGLMSLSMACNNADKDTNADTNNDSENKEDVVSNDTKDTDCELTLTDFRTFCGIEDGATIDDVIEMYGQPDSTSSVDDDSYWAYFFTSSYYPLTVEVCDSDKKIWTVYVEILSYDMESDVKTATTLLNMDECVSSLLGKDIYYAEAVLGDNYSYEDKETYDSYIYDDDDFTIEVVLDYYYEQDTDCGRIMVYFFDQLPEE